VTGGDLGVTLQVLDKDGNVVSLDSDGNINGSEGDSVSVNVTGARPGEDVAVWMFSTPLQLGVGTINGDGEFSGKFAIEGDIQGGSHRLVLKTTSYTGSESTISVGFIIGAGNDGTSAISVIIFTTLGVAVALALIIPATRRRRKRMAAA
jgi:hypothetical protein